MDEDTWVPSGSSVPAGARWAELAERTVEALLERDPVGATALGDHRFDDRLPDLSGAGVEHAQRVLADALLALDQLDESGLTTAERVDQEILRNQLAGHAFALETLREHTWNPLYANPGTALTCCWRATSRRCRTGLRSLAGRLGAVPDGARRRPRPARRHAAGPRRDRDRAVRRARPSCCPDRSTRRWTQEPLLAAEVEPARDAARRSRRGAPRLAATPSCDGAHRDPRLGPERVRGQALAHPRRGDLARRGARRAPRPTWTGSRATIARAAAAYLGEPVRLRRRRPVRRALGAWRPTGVVDDATIVPLCAAGDGDDDRVRQRRTTWSRCTTTRSRSS